MSEKHPKVNEAMRTHGRGFVMGTEVWLVRWVPVEVDCPCCEGTGTVPGRTPVEGEVYVCGACAGQKTLPIDVKIEIAKGVVSGVELHHYEYFSGDKPDPIEVVNVGYQVRAVEILAGAGKGIAVSWARNCDAKADELVETRELAEAKAKKMMENKEQEKSEASIILKKDILK